MPIRILPEEVVSQIAAGEVVERPASVVKELVENSIDAGARLIRVETERGGKKRIRVSDDGRGIPSAEVELAFRRHATSKLAMTDDLSRITTLGFRGEALASIAAVSRLTCITRVEEEPVGTRLQLEGGRQVACIEDGRPPGTTIAVEDLFFNVPARRKFLRTERTERGHIDGWLTRYAMAYPEIGFTLLHDGKMVFQSPGNGRLRDVLIEVYGLEVGAAMLAIVPPERPMDVANIQVRGFVSPPSFHRANRGYITLFVNGRWVQDARLTYAVIQAYHTMLPVGRYPLAVVMVRMPPADVDVNVHPTKSEVRFRDGDQVFRAVQRAVRQTLVTQSPIPAVGQTRVGASVEWGAASEQQRGERRQRLAALRPRVTRGEEGEQFHFEFEGHTRGSSGPDEQGIPPLRVVGQIGATYIVAEGPEGMYLIDQHAAHERVLFERLLAERNRATVVSQALLEPEVVELSPQAAALLEEHLDALSRLGFQIEPFGGHTMRVRAMPTIVAQAGVTPLQVLEDVAADIEAHQQPLSGDVEEIVARRVCKQAAIKAGQVLTTVEMQEMLRALELCLNPRTCPHGRPTMIHMSVAQLAREFGRSE